MPEYRVPESVAANIVRREAAESQTRMCGEGIGDGATCGEPAVHLFVRGWRCDLHSSTPPAVDPERTLDALRAKAAAEVNT